MLSVQNFFPFARRREFDSSFESSRDGEHDCFEKFEKYRFFGIFILIRLFLLRGQARDLVGKNVYLGVISHEKSIRGTVDM